MKNKIRKVVASVVAVVFVLSLLTVNVFAAGTTVQFNSKSLKKGETLSVTVKFTTSASLPLYGLEAWVKYDASVLELQSVEGESTSASGVKKIIKDFSGGTSGSVSLKFKAIGTGSSQIQIYDVIYASEDEMEEYTLTGATSSVSVTETSSAKSSNANLKSLEISSGSLTPKFSAGVTTYSVTIKNDVTQLSVDAKTEHSGASLKIEGSKQMKVGSNQRVVVVTAEDGTQKKYTLNITRLAADGTTPEPDEPDAETPTTERISVTADDNDMYIAENFDTENLFPGYTVDVYVYNDTEVPCIVNGDTKLVYLVDSEGANGGFYRPLDDGTFTKFISLTTQSVFYEILTPDQIPDGYSEISMDINDTKVTAYQSNDTAMTEFVLIYAKGPAGYTGFYRYDTTEQTLQRAVGTELEFTGQTEEDDGSIISNIMNMDTPVKVIAASIVGVILLLIAAVIVLIVKIVRSGKDDDEEEEPWEDTEETEEDSGFEFITVSDRDTSEDE